MSVTFPPSATPPLRHGRLRARPEDFFVEERCPVARDPAGEHCWLRVEKVGWNTADVARLLARAAGLRVRDVGYAGLKDRNAVTVQWYSLWLRRRAPPASWDLPKGIEVLEQVRCARKLRRGTHTENRFVVRMRELQGDWPGLERRLHTLAQGGGFPNYFGPQRFGRNYANVSRATALFEGREPSQNRHVRGLWISAARAWIFNHVLAARVEHETWSHLLEGDVPDTQGAPTGPLWGEGPTAASGPIARLERRIADTFPVLRAGLERTRMPPQRRPLVARPRDLRWRLDRDAGTVMLSFALAPGVYATALLAELLDSQGLREG